MKSRILGIVFAAFCGSGIAAPPGPLSQIPRIDPQTLTREQLHSFMAQTCRTHIEILTRVYGAKLQYTLETKLNTSLLKDLKPLYDRLAFVAGRTGFTTLTLAKIADQEKEWPEVNMMSNIVQCDKMIYNHYR
jgi:hypothetical protein